LSFQGIRLKQVGRLIYLGPFFPISISAANEDLTMNLIILGPYLRAFLKGCIYISGGLAISLFLASGMARVPSSRDVLIKAAVNVTIFLIFFTVVFAALRFMGRP